MEKKFSVNVKIAVLIAAWMTMASDMVITPILGEIMNAFPDISPTWSAMAYNIAGIAFIFASFITPKLCQNVVKKKMMLVCAFISIIAGGLGGIIVNLPFIVVMHFIEGFAAGICTNLIPSLIVDISRNENEVIKLNSLNGVVGTVAGFICSYLAGVIATRFGWQSAYYIYFIGFIVFVWMLIFLPVTPLETAKDESTGEKKHMNARCWLWAVEVFIFAWLVNMYWTYLATHIDSAGIGTTDITGLTISLITVTSFVGGFLMIPVTKYLKAFAMHACIVFWIIALILVINATSPAMCYASGLIWGLGQGIAFPYMYTKASLIANKGTETSAISWTTVGWYLAVGVTTIVYLPFMKMFHDESAIFALKFTVGGFIVYAVLATIRAIYDIRKDKNTAGA